MNAQANQPPSLTPAQWAVVLCVSSDYDGFSVEEFTDIETVLLDAQSTLGRLPTDHALALPEVRQIEVWDTSDAQNTDLIITVDLPGLRLASDRVEVSSFARAGLDGSDAAQAVLGELLGHRNRLLADLAAACRVCSELRAETKVAWKVSSP